jgi:hypothetical protein
MLGKVLARLKLRDKMEAQPILLDNWMVVPAMVDGFVGAFYIVDVKSNTEVFQTGLIQTVDWSDMEAMEISGQRYELGRIHHDYLDYLKEQDGVTLLNFIPEDKQVVNSLYTLELDTFRKVG